MLIKLIQINDYKRLKDVEIEPGTSSLIYIGGKNKQGKSSVLDAMTACLGGKGEEPVLPIREGAEKADIRITLEDEAEKLDYVVHKRFLKSGTSSLKVTGRDGKVSSPQKVLDRIVGTRSLDPLRFSRLSEKEQKATLLQVVDIGIDLDEWAKDKKKHYDARTDANRDAKRYQVELDGNPDPGEVEEVDSTKLVEKLNALSRTREEKLSSRSDLQSRRDAVKAMEERIARLEKELASEKIAHEVAIEKGQKARAAFDALPDVTQEFEDTQEELLHIGKKQKEMEAKRGQKERHLAAKAGLEKAKKLSDELTVMLDDMDRGKAKKLSEAKMPVKGLDVAEEGLLYNGIPLSQASGAEQLTVSLALAAAMSPELKDIWIKDGSLLDEDSLADIEKFAAAGGFRVWIERVGDHDDGAIIMEDGSIREGI